MPVATDDDEPFDRAISAAMVSDRRIPVLIGTSTIRHIAGRYELGEIIGQGGIGVVYRAKDHDLNRDVAIKVLRKEFEISRSASERFLSEARIAGQLQHAGIPPVHEVGAFADGRVYLVMKLIQGQTLSTLLRANPSRHIPLLTYFESICQTMAFAHAHGVIHCDLKPNNIMIGEFGEVHVMDWGLAKVKSEAARFAATNSSPIHTPDLFSAATPRNDHADTRGYTAPERIDHPDEMIDERCDVYSLGVMFFELMTGESYRANHAEAACERFDRAVESDRLRTLFRASISADPAGRPRDAGEIARILNDAKEAQHRTALRHKEWRRLLRVGLVVGFVIAVAVTTIIAFRVRQNLENRQRDDEMRLLVNQYLDDADRDLRMGRRLRAESAIRKAEGVATKAPEFVRQKVDERLKDLRMLERLESVRLVHSRVSEYAIPRSPTRSANAGLAFDRDAPLYYERAFREYGIDIDQVSFTDAAQSIRSRPIRDALIRSLDEWAMNVTRPADRARLRQIAEAVELNSNGMASRVRKAFDSEQSHDLLKIASELSVEESPELLFAVGHALRKRGLLDDSVQILEKARGRYPSEFWLNLELGTVHALIAPTDSARSQPWIESAFALSEGSPEVYTYLGIALASAKLDSESERSFRKALSLNPNLPGGIVRLAYVLCSQKKYQEARRVVDQSIAAQPDNAVVYFNLGIVLQLQKGDPHEIITAYRTAVRLDPTLAEAWNNLGNDLTALRQFDEADAAFRSALAARPRYSRAIFNRALLHDVRGRFDQAIEMYREAIAIEPDYSEAEYNLAHDLAYEKGRFAEAVSHLESGYRHITEKDPTRGKWQRLIDSCRTWELTDQRLDEIVKNKTDPASPLEATQLAVMAAWPHRRQYLEAVQFFEFAFARDPKLESDLIQGYRYFAAGCAARAALVPGDTQKVQRDRVREWLSADLALREKQLASPDPAIARDVKAKLTYWLTDPHLSSVRDVGPLESLLDDERRQWSEFWHRVRELQSR